MVCLKDATPGYAGDGKESTISVNELLKDINNPLRRNTGNLSAYTSDISKNYTICFIPKVERQFNRYIQFTV